MVTQALMPNHHKLWCWYCVGGGWWGKVGGGGIIMEIHLCCSLALWLGVDVAWHGPAQPQPGVHHTPNGRLLPWDAVVVIVVREILLLPPHWLLRPDRPEQRHGCL